MIQQAHSWAYNLRRQNWKDTGRQICIATVLQWPRRESNQEVHQQMSGQRRTGICTHGILAKEEKDTIPFAAPQMSLEVITQLVVSQKEKDTCPRISLIGVT